MSDIAISVEDLSKSYRIAHEGRGSHYKTLREDLVEMPKRVWSRFSGNGQSSSETFWALTNVSFKVDQGEVVGIIGRNGAGKSTLLKILSRITEPTSGEAKIYGRIGSLLEVGTGFHQELTGRENIFLNGAILGMSRQDIRKRFDEIVAFAEMERFLDTPVKRYSSGMYVRLAFAVAAHLEPEILVVDEVLAVGDADFQRKCLGKMREVSRGGRTVLFVSHNMGAVAQLCRTAILLARGNLIAYGRASDVIDQYLRTTHTGEDGVYKGTANKDNGKAITITEARAIDRTGKVTAQFGHNEPITLELSLRINQALPGVEVGFWVNDERGRKIFTTEAPLSTVRLTGTEECKATCVLPSNFLVPGRYSFTFVVHLPMMSLIDLVEDGMSITILDAGSAFSKYGQQDYGCVFADCKWDVIRQQ